MSTVKHTAGPWHVTQQSLDWLQIITVDQKRDEPSGIVALIRRVAWCNEGEENANANLIAAAPELLAACKAMVAAFTAGTAEQHSYRLAALEAITKAEGKA